MLYACAVKFDVTENFEKVFNLLGSLSLDFRPSRLVYEHHRLCLDSQPGSMHFNTKTTLLGLF